MKFYKHDIRDVLDLIPYARNSRTHSESQLNQIAASIREFGFTNPVLIDEQDNIIAGHGRCLAAEKIGMSQVPVIILENLSKAQKKAYVIADNKLALNAGWNEELLVQEILELQELDFEIELLGFDELELDGLIDDPTSEVGTTGESEPESEQVTCRIGDVWILGHNTLNVGEDELSADFIITSWQSKTNNDAVLQGEGKVFNDVASLRSKEVI